MLKKLLVQSLYNKKKRIRVINGVRHGFSLNYEGEKNVRKYSHNLKLSVGSLTELWNKVIKEVEGKRYAGPYLVPPFDTFIQSPIGLVPKDKGTKTRLIFHLSHPCSGGSVNEGIPTDLCSVKYPNFDEAVKLCVYEGRSCYIGKSDMSMAFRNAPLDGASWRWLILKCQHPLTKVTYFFVEKCLPFGSLISCKIFQDISDAIAHLVKFRTKKPTVNYLDDYFFASLLKIWCDWQVRIFLQVCEEIKFPESLEKTHWGTTRLVFLGMMLDTEKQMVCIPYDKVEKALNGLKNF